MNILEEKRKLNRYSMRQLATEIGFSHEWYRQIEDDFSLIKIKVLRQLIPKLNLSDDDILKIVKGE